MNGVKQKIAGSVTELIGNTPMVRLRRIGGPKDATILAKLESFNPGGSVKDRICLAMVEDAEARGLLKPGATVVEPTSGNTGIGLAMICAVRGYKVILTMPETMSAERIHLLKRYGAQLVLTPAKEGMMGAVRRAEAIAKETAHAFIPQQFQNAANPEAHRRTTAQEILRATGGEIDAFVAGVGTGGTITGVGEVLKKRLPKVRIVAVEPKKSPVLSGGQPGPHMIQGIGAGFVPQVLNRSVIDEILAVEDEAAYEMSRRLAKDEGLCMGMSSGAACWGAVKVAKELGSGKTVVTVFPDTGERYFSLAPLFDE
ncbi:MAG: cysteine synthase A [Candidatus Omnitrophica bacterium]|nr:cysteine synthase A [Candidatus Omnitrophota bacterium]